jgi:hypothetical protein
MLVLWVRFREPVQQGHADRVSRHQSGATTGACAAAIVSGGQQLNCAKFETIYVTKQCPDSSGALHTGEKNDS